VHIYQDNETQNLMVFGSQAHAAYKYKTDKVQSVDQADLSEECSVCVIN